jgi:hypothetical protein
MEKEMQLFLERKRESQQRELLSRVLYSFSPYKIDAFCEVLFVVFSFLLRELERPVVRAIFAVALFERLFVFWAIHGLASPGLFRNPAAAAGADVMVHVVKTGSYDLVYILS